MPIFLKFSFFLITINLSAKILPRSIVKKPAIKNRTPAKRICDAVSTPLILKNLYPIFITGKALPQRAQQSIATRATTILLVKIFFILYASENHYLLSVVLPKPPSRTPFVSSSTVMPN